MCLLSVNSEQTATVFRLLGVSLGFGVIGSFGQQLGEQLAHRLLR